MEHFIQSRGSRLPYMQAVPAIPGRPSQKGKPRASETAHERFRRQLWTNLVDDVIRPAVLTKSARAFDKAVERGMPAFYDWVTLTSAKVKPKGDGLSRLRVALVPTVSRFGKQWEEAVSVSLDVMESIAEIGRELGTPWANETKYAWECFDASVAWSFLMTCVAVMVREKIDVRPSVQEFIRVNLQDTAMVAYLACRTALLQRRGEHDPLSRALAEAEGADEELTVAEMSRLDEALRDTKRSEVVDSDTLRRELGLD